MWWPRLRWPETDQFLKKSNARLLREKQQQADEIANLRQDLEDSRIRAIEANQECNRGMEALVQILNVEQTATKDNDTCE